MATLTGNAINTSYQGLLKTVDNGVVGATEKQITDGEGNAIPMSAGTSGVSFPAGITLKSADTTEELLTLTDSDLLSIGGDTIPANDTATPTLVNRFWSGTQAQYDALGAYDASTIYYIV